MVQWRALSLGLLLTALAACGGATTTSNQPIVEPTASVAPRGTSAPSIAAQATATRGVTALPSASPAPGTSAAATATRGAASAAPSATRPAAAPSATAIPQPNGTIPAGWKIYRGSVDFPFVVAYPPDWTADDSLLPDQRIVYFYGPDGRDNTPERIDIEISDVGDGSNIDVQRDQFFRQESEFCVEKGIEYTEHRQIAGATFAILGATCDASNDLSFMQVASGLKYGDEWNILMRTPYDRKDGRLRQIFDPMLASFNVYAKIP